MEVDQIEVIAYQVVGLEVEPLRTAHEAQHEPSVRSELERSRFLACAERQMGEADLFAVEDDSRPVFSIGPGREPTRRRISGWFPGRLEVEVPAAAKKSHGANRWKDANEFDDATAQTRESHRSLTARSPPRAADGPTRFAQSRCHAPGAREGSSADVSRGDRARGTARLRETSPARASR
jgi:hypothetical protein